MVLQTLALPQDSIEYYVQKSGKRVTLEAALLHNQNTSVQSAKNLINFARGIDVNINLIPWYAVPSRSRTLCFQ